MKADEHPQITEARKRLDAAKDAYLGACAAIDRQYLKPLVGQGDKAVLAQVKDVRHSFDIAVPTVATEAHQQPVDSFARTARRVATTRKGLLKKLAKT